MAARDKAGPHALEQSRLVGAFVERSNTDQPNDIAQGTRLRDIGRAHFADTGRFDVGEVDPRAEPDRGQYRELVRSIDAFDVEGGVGFGIALLLRRLEHLAEIRAGMLHFGKDVIAGPVEYPVDSFDAVCCRTFAQTLHYRDAARDRSFELERDAAQRRLFGEC